MVKIHLHFEGFLVTAVCDQKQQFTIKKRGFCIETHIHNQRFTVTSILPVPFTTVYLTSCQIVKNGASRQL